MMIKKFIAFLIMSPFPMASIGQETDFRQIDLFENGLYGAANYRIPSLVTTAEGTLLAVCDRRGDRPGDLPNNIDLVIRRSEDNGITWSDPQVIVDYPGTEGGADPNMIVDRENGTVWLFYVYGATGVGINSSKKGLGVDSTLQLHARHSTDDGHSWSEPRNLTREIKDPEWAGIFFASGRGIQTSDGTLLVPLMVRKTLGTSGNDHAYVAFSSDHGKTWQISSSAGDEMGESKLVELDDGTIMINMRSKHKLGQRAVNISRDQGRSWSEYYHDPNLIEPVCNASIIRYTSVRDGYAKSRLLFSNPASTEKREKMAVRISYDEGKSWSDPKIIYDGPAAYSSLTVLPDGNIGLFYERGNNGAAEKITFARFSLEWLTDGEDQIVK